MLKRLSLIAIVFLSGCQKQHQESKHNGQKHDAYVVYHEQELKQRELYNSSKTVQYQKEIDADAVDIDMINVDYVWTVDVPIPLKAIEKKNYYKARTNSYSVGYSVALAHDDLVSFYKNQMELYGWHCWWQTQGLESLLLFEKAHKHCAISIRPSSSRNKQDIIVLQKTV